MQCFIIFLVTIKQKPTESSCFYMRIVSFDVSFKRLCFSALRRTPRRAQGVEMKAESISPLMLQTMSSQHIRDFIEWCSPQRPTSGARIALWWHCVQHKVQAMPNESGGQLNIVSTHCSIQNQVLIVPSPNKKLCQLRALISTSAIGVLRIIEINLSPMCIFCIGKSSNVYIGLIQIERNNTRQYGKCRGKIFSN